MSVDFCKSPHHGTFPNNDGVPSDIITWTTRDQCDESGVCQDCRAYYKRTDTERLRNVEIAVAKLFRDLLSEI